MLFLVFLNFSISMQMFHDKKVGISVLAVVVAIGINTSCLKRQSAPKKMSLRD